MRKTIAATTAAALLASVLAVPIDRPVRAEGTGGGSPAMLTNAVIASEADKWTVMPDAPAAPVIDGELDEALWGSATVIGGFRTGYAQELVSNGPVYRLAYDSSYLYLGGVIDVEEAADLARIELVVRPDANDGTYAVATIPVNPNSRLISANWALDWDPGRNWSRLSVTSFEKALTEKPSTGTVQVEAAIPLASLGLVPPLTAGDELRLNLVHVFELGTRPMTSWQPLRTAHLSDGSVAPEGGPVTAAANLLAEDRLGSVYAGQPPLGQRWVPDEWALGFAGFTQKQLNVALPSAPPSPATFALHWREPGGDWKPMAIDSDVITGGQAMLEFTHPEPLADGRYELKLQLFESIPSDGLEARFSFDRDDLIEAGLDAVGRVFSPYGTPTAVTPAPASAEVQQIMALIPDQFGVPHVGLPENPELRPNFALYRLSEDGTHLIANDTDTVYPNPLYPETKSMSVVNRKDQTVTYPYYEDEGGRKYFFSAALWNHQLRRARDEASALVASDPLGAARLLHRFAEKSAGYVLRTNNEWNTYPADSSSGPPYNARSGYWSVWKAEELNHLVPFVEMYRTIKSTDALEVLSDELDVDVERIIWDELFAPPLEYVISQVVNMHNVDPYIWQRLTEIGKAWGMPDMVHLTVEWIDGFMQSQFLSDGFWKEVTPSYHLQVLNNVTRAMNELAGYTDPPGYVSPRTGVRFDNLNLSSLYPNFGQASQLLNQLAYPNGKQVAVQDTWASTVRTPQTEAGPLLLPVSGIGRLTAGQGASQTQLYTMYTPKYGHPHWDPLNLTLFAEGQELLPDIGYTYTKYRQFATSTMGHNTVVVNSRNMTNDGISRHGGKIEAFAAENGFQAMRASYGSAYPETDRYSREPWLVPFGGATGGAAYTLDLFRVSGGDRHEYTLNGEANLDAYFRTPLQLSDYGPYLLPPGTPVQEPTTNQDFGSADGHYPGYIYVRDVKEADLSGQDRFETTLVTLNASGAEQAKLHITGLLEPGDNELFLGRSPSLRTTRLNGGGALDNNVEADKYDLPKLVLRRSGSDLDSIFVTLMEPYKGVSGPRIEWAERLEADVAPDGAAAVRIVYGDWTDIVLSNPYGAGQPLVVGDMVLYGEMGLIRLYRGEVQDMFLANGSLLAKGSQQVTGADPVAGTLTGTTRLGGGGAYNALVTDTFVPDAAIGQYVTVMHPDGSTAGFRVEQVVRDGGQSTMMLGSQDPGFSIASGRTEQLFYPRQLWNGVSVFQLGGYAEETGIPPQGGQPVGTITGTILGSQDEPLAGANVWLTGNTALAAVTAPDGSFTLSGVTEGWQRVTAARSGYAQAVSEAVYVSVSGTATVSLALSNMVPPTVTGAPLAALAGEVITAASSKDGMLYLVPAGTPAVPEAIESAAATGGASSPATAAATVTLDTYGMAPGRYLVYAIDGNPMVSSALSVMLIPDTLNEVDDPSPYALYAGSWIELQNAGYAGGSSRYSNTKDSYIEIPFYGKQAIVYGHRNSAGGLADVYVDGVLVGTADYYSAQQVLQQEIFNTGLLMEGAHMMRIVVRGERSVGTSAYAQVRFDRLRVLAEHEIPPVLSGATSGTFATGIPLVATSSADGGLYLVPETTAATSAAVLAAASWPNGSSTTVTAGVYGTLATSGLHTDRYRIYAIDTNGNLSLASAPITLLDASETLIDSASGAVHYFGDWRLLENLAYVSGSSRYAGTKDEYVDIPFYGTGAIVLGHRNSSGGLADVYVDGVYAGTVDYYAAELAFQVPIFETDTLMEGVHTIRLVVTGERSTGTSQYRQVRFDALQLVNAP